MDRDPAAFELLRQQLDDMQAQQRCTGATADPSFWEQAASAASVFPTGAAGVFTGGSGTAHPQQERGRERQGQAKQSHARTHAPRSRRVRPGGGVFAGLPADVLEDYDLSSVAWADDDVMSDPGWIASVREQSERLADEADSDAGRRDVVDAVVVESVAGMSLARHDATDLAVTAQWVAAQRASHEVMLVNIVAELGARGVEAPGGLSRVDWLRSLDPGLSATAARAITVVGAAFGEARWARLRMLVTTQQVPVGNAAQVVEFSQRVEPVGDADEVRDAVDDLCAQARTLRPEELARLVRHHTEQVRPPRDRDEEALDAGRQSGRGLWFGQPNRSGMVSMRGILDPEAAAVVKAAVDPLSAPCPTKDEHGNTLERDPRSPARRRADALVEMIERGVAAGDGVRTTDKAKVVVLIDFDALRGELAEQLPDWARARGEQPGARRTGPGSGRGTARTLTGDVLSAATARRIACDAGIIPLVLGTDGEPLDVGREKRLVHKGLRLALVARDQGCSFPGCSIPAQWTDAHHVVHWARGGSTSLLTTALLCERHHTHVHRYDLTATVTATSVTWHV